jgi:hypothetical protein
LEVLAKKYELLSIQISIWKAEAIKNMSVVFNLGKAVAKKAEIPTEKLLYDLDN